MPLSKTWSAARKHLKEWGIRHHWHEPITRYHRVRLLLLVLSLILLGMTLWGGEHSDSLAIRVAGALGEALLVTFVIAIIVEPYMRRNFLTEVGGNTIWELVNPKAPEEYRTAMATLLARRQYYRRREWDLIFDWEDRNRGVLKVEASVLTFGYNAGAKAYGFTQPVWIDSCHGYESTYTYFMLQSDQSRLFVEKRQRDLQHFMTVDQDGTRLLDLPALLGGTTVSAETSFTTRLTGVMYRLSNGYLPLVQTQPTLEHIVKIKGNALPDLTFRMLAPRGGTVQETARTRAQQEITFHVQSVMMPGQVVLLSWKPG